MRVVIYGAGNIGRGFLGQIFSRSKEDNAIARDLIFVDTDETVVDGLNRDGRYPIRILKDNLSLGDKEDVWIEGVRAINGGNGEAVEEAIATADIMTTSVGVRALPLVAPLIAAGLKKRFERDRTNAQCSNILNIIICENLIDADKALSELIKKQLSEEEQKIFDQTVGLVEASIGRMVPLQTGEMQDGNPLRVCVEEYGFLPVDKKAFKGAFPAFEGLIPCDNFDFYIQRKIFIHNMGHGICAYFGLYCENTYIYEAASNGNILFIAQNAMLESALALSSRFHTPLSDLHHHIRDLLRRFSNKALKDTCSRVGADTSRKLGNQDRFIGALSCCTEEGINPAFISVGIATALYSHLAEKGLPQSQKAALTVLKEVSGLDEAHTGKILLFHSLLSSSDSGDPDKTIEKIIRLASEEGQTQGII